MKTLFLTVLTMSLTAGCVAAVVMLARLPLKKAPRIFSYLLWGVVLFRLLCPLSFQSVVSVFTPVSNASRSAATPEASNIQSGIPPIDNLVGGIASPPVSVSVVPETPMPAPKPFDFVLLGSWLWLAGAVGVAGYAAIAYGRLKRRLRTAARLEKGLYETDRITSPFVLGFLRPKIYIPAGLPDAEREYILLHERTHLRRGDHIVKLISFLALAAHWFNPLMWISYRLMVRDMEMSCDERVMKTAGGDIRQRYSASLLALSARRNGLPFPLAFGEIGVKARIKNILRYKKTAVGIAAAAVVAVVAVTAALLANPMKPVIAGDPGAGTTTIVTGSVGTTGLTSGTTTVTGATGASAHTTTALTTVKTTTFNTSITTSQTYPRIDNDVAFTGYAQNVNLYPEQRITIKGDFSAYNMQASIIMTRGFTDNPSCVEVLDDGTLLAKNIGTATVTMLAGYEITNTVAQYNVVCNITVAAATTTATPRNITKIIYDTGGIAPYKHYTLDFINDCVTINHGTLIPSDVYPLAPDKITVFLNIINEMGIDKLKSNLTQSPPQPGVLYDYAYYRIQIYYLNGETYSPDYQLGFPPAAYSTAVSDLTDGRV